MKPLLELRNQIARRCERRALKREVSIVSEDCWGGQVYRNLKLPYRTPFVGLWIVVNQYLDVIENLRRPDAFELKIVDHDADYPVGETPYGQWHFMHDDDPAAVPAKFARRVERMVWENLCVKIDFGKKGYTDHDIERWNRLALPNAVAFLPPRLSDRVDEVHGGVVIPDWVGDGVEIYYVSKHHFDLFHWLSTGSVRSTRRSRAFENLLGDPRTPRFALDRLRGKRRG